MKSLSNITKFGVICMKITVLGKYGPFPAKGGATSSYLLENKTLVAFEFGAGAYSKISAITDINNISALVLSHFHFDHCSDVGVLCYALQRFFAEGKRDKLLDVYCPNDNSPLFEAIKNMRAFNIHIVSDGDKVKIGDLEFEFHAVNHPVPCLGFIATDGVSHFVYGGDSNECENIDKMLADADLALLDGGLLERDYAPNKPHLSVKRVAMHAKKFNVKTIITHLNPEYQQEEMQTEANSIYSGCIFAEEGKSYIV